MELAMHLISKDKSARTTAEHDLNDFSSQSLATQSEKGEQFDSSMPSIKKAFDILDVDIVELSTENEALTNEKGTYNDKWIKES